MFEGFGTSLCWWANIKYSEEIKNEIIELLFGETGLQMNIVRYNLGGGHNDKVIQNMRPGGCVPCIQNKDGTFDLNNDNLQISILNESIKNSVNKVELFCNSPPWWMTKSGLTNGNTKAWITNLKNDNILDFIVFIVESYKILSKIYPIVSVEPFNEPSNPFWSPEINQEGCYYNYITRHNILKDIKKECPSIPLVSFDESHSLFALLSLPFLPKCTNRINIHGYNSFDYKLFGLFDIKLNFFDWTIWRKFIRFFTNKPIWMSEFGMGYVDEPLESCFSLDSLKLARNIFRDLQTLKPTAWIYWQAVENLGTSWGLLQVDFNNPNVIIIQKQYYIFKHFTRTLKEGDTYEFINKYVLQINNNISNKKKFIILNDTNKPIDINIPIDINTKYTYTITDINNNYQVTETKVKSVPSYSIMSIT